MANQEIPTVHFGDAHLLVAEKPADMLAVPGRGPEKQDCLVSRLRERFPDLPAQPAVHRLDMQTSGLMLLARTPEAHRHLSRQFHSRLVLKRYIAIIEGIPAASSGIIELAFRLDPEDRPRQILDPINGKQGITLWKKLSTSTGRTRIEFTPLTGRTHQLRLHAFHPSGLGCPIVGDRLYGGGQEKERLLLHASYISFNHPESGALLEFFSPPPF